MQLSICTFLSTVHENISAASEALGAFEETDDGQSRQRDTVRRIMLDPEEREFFLATGRRALKAVKDNLGTKER